MPRATGHGDTGTDSPHGSPGPTPAPPAPAWPYWAPYLAFGALLAVEPLAPASAAAPLLVLRGVIPLAVVAVAFSRGAYPELRGNPSPPWARLADALVGLGSAALWVAPYVVWDALRPEDAEAFDAGVFGAGREPLAIAARALGYAVATPLVEELFVRSWLARTAETWGRSGDFRDAEVGRLSLRGFAAVTLWFVFTHATWEAPVAFAWIALTNLWFMRRRRLGAMVRVHAVANASILLFVATCDGVLRDGAGRPLSLWFLV
jgi:CAAX prenyl protease-like protein